MSHLVRVNVTNSFLCQKTFPSPVTHKKMVAFSIKISICILLRRIVKKKKRQFSVPKWNFQLPNLFHWQRLLTYVSEEELSESGHHSEHVSNACRSDMCWSPFNARGQNMSDTCWLLPSYTTRQMIGDRKGSSLTQWHFVSPGSNPG